MEKIIHSAASRIMTALLRELRERAGLKQEELAAQIGALRQTVSAIERGERMLMALELWSYLRPLGVTPPEFIALLDQRLAAQNVFQTFDGVDKFDDVGTPPGEDDKQIALVPLSVLETPRSLRVQDLNEALDDLSGRKT